MAKVKAFAYDMQTAVNGLELPGWNKVKQVGSAWIITNGECTLVVTVMGRQDFKMSWGVMFTECDGGVKSETGLTKRNGDVAKAVNKALRRVCDSAYFAEGQQ